MSADKIVSFTVADSTSYIAHLPADLLDRVNISTAIDELLAFVDQERPLFLVIDCQLVEKLSSEAIGGLVRLAARMRSYRGDLNLARITGRVREVLNICGLLGTVFEEYPSTDEALQARKNA